MLELDKRFASEEACLQYLTELRWPGGFRCPRCGSGKAWHAKRGLYHCGNCGHRVSVTAGTVFQDTRKPLRMWFRAIWSVTSQKHGVSALWPSARLEFGQLSCRLGMAAYTAARDGASGTRPAFGNGGSGRDIHRRWRPQGIGMWRSDRKQMRENTCCHTRIK